MIYYIYKITLLKGSLSGKYYFGQHRTKNINDGYAGSGRIIKDYYKKYGKIEGVTYIKKIINFYNSETELNKAEELIIGDKYVSDLLCINIRPGGKQQQKSGCGKKGYKLSEETKQKMKLAKQKMTDETKKKIGEWRLGKTFKPHTEATKLKISKSMKKHFEIQNEKTEGE